MSRMFFGSIDVSKIDKSKLFQGQKGNYCNVTIWLNDEKDNYGNILSIQEGQTKEERDSGVKKNYLGNLKEHVSGASNTGQSNQPAPEPITSDDSSDELPF